ncbi:MAG: GNAT family N-acetyltransferase [Lachnospiraceae bacterium]|nr:GNAT family N-acetyltransferase [Lachnospiraceae bacterium]
MQLREYRKEDGDYICKWVLNEEELYKWSADRICKFPFTGEDLWNEYKRQSENLRFQPMTATDEAGKPIGHLFIRFPGEKEEEVRFGFVIVDPQIRGKGCGREMLQLAIEYVKANFQSERITLGVFANNEKAKRCYESLGFTRYHIRDCQLPIGNWECIDLELNMK